MKNEVSLSIRTSETRFIDVEPFTMQKQSLLRNFNKKRHVWAMFQEIGGSAPNPGHYNEHLNQHGLVFTCL